MSITIRVPSSLLKQVITDLARPHAYAGERVGFLSAKTSKLSDNDYLILFNKYFQVPDDRYLNNPLVGATIDGKAIRNIMQHILSTGDGAFHVHSHSHVCLTGKNLNFSRVDINELIRLIPSFQAVGPSVAHGAFLLDKIRCISIVWLPGEHKPCAVDKISVIGNPMQFFGV
jgi:hypothetical protein